MLHQPPILQQLPSRLASHLLPHGASLPPHSRVVSLSIDNRAAISTISRPGYPHLPLLLREIRNATIALSRSGSVAQAQVGWTPGPLGIAGNDLVDAAAKLAAEGSLSIDIPWPYSHLRSQVRNQPLRLWQTCHKRRDDFLFLPSTDLPAIFALPPHTATHLFRMKLLASYLLGHPKLAPPRTGALPAM